MAERKTKSVLFLCTGNYYRSRFAEVLFNSVASRMGLNWQASSRGLALERGVNNHGPMAVLAVKTLQTMGVRANEAISRFPAQVTNEELEKAERIVALKKDEHFPLLEERYPGWAEKVEFWDVEDDSKALPIIEKEVNSFVARLLGGGEREVMQAKEAAIVEKPVKEPVKKAPTVKVGRETAGRRGKGVTTVFDLTINEAQIKELAALLKQKCGTGGTVKDGKIEIQGDQRDRIVEELERLGYKVKRAGG
jgi:protein-tyrosine phosphatase